MELEISEISKLPKFGNKNYPISYRGRSQIVQKKVSEIY